MKYNYFVLLITPFSLFCMKNHEAIVKYYENLQLPAVYKDLFSQLPLKPVQNDIQNNNDSVLGSVGDDNRYLEPMVAVTATFLKENLIAQSQRDQAGFYDANFFATQRFINEDASSLLGLLEEKNKNTANQSKKQSNTMSITDLEKFIKRKQKALRKRAKKLSQEK